MKNKIENNKVKNKMTCCVVHIDIGDIKIFPDVIPDEIHETFNTFNEAYNFVVLTGRQLFSNKVFNSKSKVMRKNRAFEIEYNDLYWFGDIYYCSNDFSYLKKEHSSVNIIINSYRQYKFKKELRKVPIKKILYEYFIQEISDIIYSYI